MIQKTLLHRLVYWLPPVGWALLILLLGGLSVEPGPVKNLPFWDKFLHAFFYGVMAFLLMRALVWEWPDRPGRAVLLAVVFVAVYGAADEIRQAFVPARNMDPLDWLSDLAGRSWPSPPTLWKAGKPMLVKQHGDRTHEKD